MHKTTVILGTKAFVRMRIDDEASTRCRHYSTSRAREAVTSVYVDPRGCSRSVSCAADPLHNRVVLLPNVITKSECALLMRAAAESLDDRAAGEPLRRMRVRLMSAEAREMSTTIIRRRVLPMLERDVPDVAAWLLRRREGRVPYEMDVEDLEAKRQESGRHAPIAGDAASLSPLGPSSAMRLCFPEEEPAVNVYCSGGKFPLHDDGHDVSVVILLSPPGAFEGGGTQYWPQDDDDKWGRGQSGAAAGEAPTLIQPPQGTA